MGRLVSALIISILGLLVLSQRTWGGSIGSSPGSAFDRALIRSQQDVDRKTLVGRSAAQTLRSYLKSGYRCGFQRYQSDAPRIWCAHEYQGEEPCGTFFVIAEIDWVDASDDIRLLPRQLVNSVVRKIRMGCSGVMPDDRPLSVSPKIQAKIDRFAGELHVEQDTLWSLMEKSLGEGAGCSMEENAVRPSLTCTLLHVWTQDEVCVRARIQFQIPKANGETIGRAFVAHAVCLADGTVW